MVPLGSSSLEGPSVRTSGASWDLFCCKFVGASACNSCNRVVDLLFSRERGKRQPQMKKRAGEFYAPIVPFSGGQ
jgi:hypothetical protein